MPQVSPHYQEVNGLLLKSTDDPVEILEDALSLRLILHSFFSGVSPRNQVTAFW